MQSHCLHGCDSHDFMTRGIVGFEHGVKDALEVADLISGVRSS